MKRALLLLTEPLDSVTALAKLFAARPELRLPHLFSFGLWKIATGDVLSARAQGTRASWGRLHRRSPGHDRLSSHWEMAGVVSPEPFARFETVPEDLLPALARACRTKFLTSPGLEEHRRTGHPVLAMGPDAALEISAHAEVIAPARLLEICRQARRVADRWRIARVIARPTDGAPRELAMVPPRTILNAVAERGLEVLGIGRVAELFAGSGITRALAVTSPAEGLEFAARAFTGESDGLVFASLGDFSPGGYGHDAAMRRLVELDAWLGALLPMVEPDDLVILTGAGRDGGDVPLMALPPGHHGPLGTRSTFADVAASLAEFFHLPPWPVGASFLRLR